MKAVGRLRRLGGAIRYTVGAATAIGAFAFMVGDVDATGAGGPKAKGTYEKGKLEVELYRGAAQPLELVVIPTPNDCNGHIDLKMEWDEEENEVTVKLKGKNVLEPYPDVDRTVGVDFKPNPWFPEPEDITDGRYQLWIVTNGRALTFYYDPGTLDLMGSELDFPGGPPPGIPVPFPTLRLFPSPFFQPKANGDLDYEWTFPYDQVVRGDLPHLSEYYLTFPPPNLCQVNPFQIHNSHLRPYGSKPLQAAEGPSFAEYLRGGLIFDITVEPPEYFTDRAIQTGVGSYSQTTMIGVIPNGQTLDIDAVFGNVGPPIRPWSGAGECNLNAQPFHKPDANFCP